MIRPWAVLAYSLADVGFLFAIPYWGDKRACRRGWRRRIGRIESGQAKKSITDLPAPVRGEQPAAKNGGISGLQRGDQQTERIRVWRLGGGRRTVVKPSLSYIPMT
jgi:hypothetical protein